MAAGYGTGVEGAGDPNAGRHTVWIVGAVGIAAIVAYGSYQIEQRTASTAEVTAASTQSAAPPKLAPAEQLFAQVDAAQQSLDVAALDELEDELATAEERAATREEAHEIRLVRAESIATRALEASIRAGTVAGDKQAARKVAVEAIAEARALVEALEADNVDPVRLLALRVRLDLAMGNDVAIDHPVVLLPGYHDAEVRIAALARPLWNDADVDSEELAEIVSTMQASSVSTGLTRSLLGLALAWQGESEAATQEIDAVLAAVPEQPLAAGLRGRLTELAVASTPAAEGGVAELVAEAEVEVEPDVKEEPTKAEPAKAEPAKAEPAKAEPAKAEPAKAEPAKAEPAKAEPEPEPEPDAVVIDDDPNPTPTELGKPVDTTAKKPRSNKGEFDALLSEGCKLARGGDAQKGFALLKKAHDLQPGGAKVTLCMAQAQARLRNVPSARALADRVLRKAPNNKAALLFAADLEADAGNAAAAKRLYQRLLVLEPENAKAKGYIESH